MLGAFVALAGLITNGIFHGGLWIAMLGLPVALHAIFVCFRDFQKRQLIIANRNTIILQSVVSLLMMGGFYMGTL